MPGDLIHKRTLIELRDLASNWGVVRRISDAFEAEGFVQGPFVEDVHGERRTTFATFANVIDWSDHEQVGRALHVFEEILSWRPTNKEYAQYADAAVEKVRRALDRDGYVLDEAMTITPKGFRQRLLPLEKLRDPAAIEEHLERLAGAVDDPPLAISSAKALLEATCKLVLDDLGEAYDEKADVPALVKSVQKALKLDQASISPTAKGRETIIRLLSNLSQVAIGVAELRNEYGTDHGRSTATTGLGPRHAHLAVGASHTFCQFLLETLEARRRVQTP